MDNNNQNPSDNNSSSSWPSSPMDGANTPQSPTPTNPLAGPAPTNPLSDNFTANTISPTQDTGISPQTISASPQESAWPAAVPAAQSQNPTPTFTPPAPTEPSAHADLAAALNAPVPGSPAPTLSPLPPTEPAPTDLSQLTGNNEQPPPPEIYTPPVSNQDTLVVQNQPQAIPESMKTPESHSSLPKFLIFGGVVVVLLVAAVSAYFILGIGKQSSTPQSTTQPAPTAEPSVVIPSASPGNFGDLNGSSATSSSKPKSAIDLLRERQSPSPSVR